MSFKDGSPLVPCQELWYDLFYSGFSLSFVKSQKGMLVGGPPCPIVFIWDLASEVILGFHLSTEIYTEISNL